MHKEALALIKSCLLRLFIRLVAIFLLQEDARTSLCSGSGGEGRQFITPGQWLLTDSWRSHLKTGLGIGSSFLQELGRHLSAASVPSSRFKAQRSSRKDEINPPHTLQPITHVNLGWQQPLDHFSLSASPPKIPEAEKKAVRSTPPGSSPALAGPDQARKHLLGICTTQPPSPSYREPGHGYQSQKEATSTLCYQASGLFTRGYE